MLQSLYLIRNKLCSYITTHAGDAELGLKLDPATFIHDFFKSGHKAIDALTWHQYYLKGSTATVHDFINATVMDTFKKQVSQLQMSNFKSQIWNFVFTLILLSSIFIIPEFE